VTAADYVIDLGSGDGRIVIAAAQRGATALGIEYNPDMVNLSRENARKAGVEDKASFVQADIFESDFSKASVITMYLLPDLNLKLRPKILNLEPGTRIVSHAFSMGEWEPDASEMSGGRNLYMWIVPAKVKGTWTWVEDSRTSTLNLKQTFQAIEGSVSSGGSTEPILDAALRGDQIGFTCGKRYYAGKITRDQIRGRVEYPGGASEWVATRKSQPEK
jgi:SAM-dependent methyltransferase